MTSGVNLPRILWGLTRLNIKGRVLRQKLDVMSVVDRGEAARPDVP
jgi:hypothetical protein